MVRPFSSVPESLVMASPARAARCRRRSTSRKRARRLSRRRQLERLREQRGEVPRVDAAVSSDADEELGELPLARCACLRGPLALALPALPVGAPFPRISPMRLPVAVVLSMLRRNAHGALLAASGAPAPARVPRAGSAGAADPPAAACGALTARGAADALPRPPSCREARRFREGEETSEGTP